ncbi:tRNA adenosine(34) deaminase TadA [Syntrophomonas wolfei]|uniref:tRNA-specific adenosine deaminase n=1 Tax=Syntrophomonas wolfei subsp. wolfei (strain DSM 2245B / Goettingen) TaxID=335541 RepID=Q0B0Y2_SYNWW|nr:tRNA adenosine(34) deaminase TadA [Syntrophomonas wolfei]ABI67372.1 tRNA-adenosine deaminase [Syntrophomonas wolfei subsp. wolfei str. Goettingen G311]
MQHEDFMRHALEEAREAYKRGEIPVGAIVVHNGKIIARAHNEKESYQDATAHAEMLALQRAARHLGHWRLNESVLYCTLEPCVMCAGAMVNVRLGHLVYGVTDPKAGSAGSIYDIVRSPALNHQVVVEGGVLKEECSELLKRFFASLRRDG